MQKISLFALWTQVKNVCASVMLGGRPVNWIMSGRYLGIYLESSFTFKCSFAANKAKLIVDYIIVIIIIIISSPTCHLLQYEVLYVFSSLIYFLLYCCIVSTIMVNKDEYKGLNGLTSMAEYRRPSNHVTRKGRRVTTRLRLQTGRGERARAQQTPRRINAGRDHMLPTCVLIRCQTTTSSSGLPLGDATREVTGALTDTRAHRSSSVKRVGRDEWTRKYFTSRLEEICVADGDD